MKADSAPVLRMRGIRKRFGPTVALDGVDLDVDAGEIVALIGENGAGKSTLMKVLSGALRPDAGSIDLGNRAYAPANPLEGHRAGVRMVYQELNLAPDLSVEENLLLGREPSCCGWISRSRRRAEARSALEFVGCEHLDLNTPVRRLPVADRQMVEIARSCRDDARVLVLDEPTSSLGRGEADRLFAVVRRLRDRGVAVVYISHFLEECFGLAERYVVLRDGKAVGAGRLADTDEPSIVRLMVGRTVDAAYPKVPRTPGDVLLEVRGIGGRNRPEAVSFTLRRGEILGIAGLVGAGRTETLRVLFGLDRLETGRVLIRDRETIRTTPCERLAAGMGLVSEDRKEEGLMTGASVAENLTLTRLRPYTRWGLVSGRRQRAAAAEWVRKLNVKSGNVRQRISALSGGNQQKIALGRLLHHEAEILLLDEPTRGIDVGSKSEIYQLIGELASRGKAVLLVSSYLPELFGVCDRIGVMARGRMVAVRPVPEWTEESVLAAAIGSGEKPES